jgi:hypothetical protein
MLKVGAFEDRDERGELRRHFFFGLGGGSAYAQSKSSSVNVRFLDASIEKGESDLPSFGGLPSERFIALLPLSIPLADVNRLPTPSSWLAT